MTLTSFLRSSRRARMISKGVGLSTLSKAKKVLALCDCFQDEVFEAVIASVRITASSFIHAEGLLRSELTRRPIQAQSQRAPSDQELVVEGEAVDLHTCHSLKQQNGGAWSRSRPQTFSSWTILLIAYAVSIDWRLMPVAFALVTIAAVELDAMPPDDPAAAGAWVAFDPEATIGAKPMIDAEAVIADVEARGTLFARKGSSRVWASVSTHTQLTVRVEVESDCRLPKFRPAYQLVNDVKSIIELYFSRSVIDVSLLAAIAALLSLGDQRLTETIIHDVPVAITFGFFTYGGPVVVDPSRREEALITGSLTLIVTQAGKLLFRKKEGVVKWSELLWPVLQSRVADVSLLKEWVERQESLQNFYKTKEKPFAGFIGVQKTWKYTPKRLTTPRTKSHISLGIAARQLPLPLPYWARERNESAGEHVSIRRIDALALRRLQLEQRRRVRGSSKLLKITICFSNGRTPAGGQTSLGFEFAHLLGAFIERDYVGDALVTSRSLVGDLVCSWAPLRPKKEHPWDFLRRFETTMREHYPKESIFQSLTDAKHWLKKEEKSMRKVLEKSKRTSKPGDDLPFELCTRDVTVIGCYIPFVMEEPKGYDPPGEWGTEEEEDKREKELLALMFYPKLKDEILTTMLEPGLKLFEVHFGQKIGNGWTCFYKRRDTLNWEKKKHNVCSV
ncbi:uncharacterized protein LOC9656058 [Selaginella moellendorffii]|uniref:uncharacterized protein LOC9656058 n=1 Tax=Selaginella moellendorffii TaxID=88036 RepID=UPI000D1C5072|nr:uncharacterized protein LOC9656058 [Selaginella moellendorffii]|eukprot:XP_024517626.1 uncharacterized protein LOC9656058 [Selaginella moellendorffii]